MKMPVQGPSCDQIIDILPDPFVLIDRNYRIVAANKNYLRHYGMRSADEVVGQHCYQISHRVDSPCSQHGEHCPLEEVFATRQATQVMHVHYDQHGDEEHVQIHTTPLFDEQGKVLYVGEYIYAIARPSEDQILIGRSRAMMRLLSLLQRVAQTPTCVLIQGESGVGKERVAEYLHQFSPRAKMPFVIVDCSTLGENLIESELFGHERGSFTGANKQKKGLFESADGGTLFIDEIGELPLSLQTRLLRVLESGTFRRLGGTSYHKANVRILAASNRDLLKMVEQGLFRQDLYYRLSAFPIQVPPLRERVDDIPLLAEYFLARSEDADRLTPLSPEVLEALMSYHYPGNVRELRNIIERAAILAYGQELLRPEHLLFDEATVPEAPPLAAQPLSPGNVDRNDGQNALLYRRNGRLCETQVMQALEACDGHRLRAAQMLGVSERTLYRYVNRLRGEEPV